MEKNKFYKKLPFKQWMMIALGIILMSLSVIIGSNETPIGHFFTYCFSYLFGIFYPLFILVFFLFGLSFVIRRRGLSVKGHFMFMIGLIFLLLAILSLGSLSIYQADHVTFTELNNYYSLRMKSLAQSSFEIDSLESIGELGGGYIGLFLVTLLGSAWGYVGNCIFFIFFMLIGLFFISYRSMKKVVRDIQKKQDQKVEYSSPFHPEKGKEEEHLDRNNTIHFETPIMPEKEPETVPAELKQPISQNWMNLSDTEKHYTGSTLQASVNAALSDESLYVKSSKTTAEASNKTTIEKTYVEQKKPSIDSYIRTNNNSFTSETENSTNKAASPSASNFELDEQALLFKKGATSQQKNTFDAIDPIIPDVPLRNEVQHTETYTPEPTPVMKPYTPVNPLEAVAKNVQPKETKAQTFTVEEPVKPTPAPEPALTEEEETAEIEKRYFTEKQRKLIDAIQKREREKNERKAQLMRFVSDVPKFYDYQLPNDSFLEEHDDSAKMTANTASAQKKIETINEVFKSYGVKAKANSFTIGASVTRINVEVEPGEKSDHISNIANELQRSLNGDKSVRVETVVEGTDTSGIEVGNAEPMAVAFKDIFEQVELNTKDNLLIPIGKDISGNIITSPLNKMPHLLVAGTTGSGKSVLVHSMIMTLIMRNYPSQLKFILIDPKQVEFVRYQECSHLLCPVISKAETAVLALKKLCDEMDRRFTVLKNCRVANLEEYNKLRVGKEAQMEQLPAIVCVIDEFADLMMVGGKDITSYVTRIGQKARAAGIHMIIATQRPSKDNVPMIIKANIPARIGLSVATNVDSRVILDEPGAETLLGRGDLLFKNPGSKSLVRAQSPYLSDDEINRVLSYVKEKAGDPVYDKEFIELAEMEEDEPIVVNSDPNQNLYGDVKDFVIHTGITSKERIMKNFQVNAQKADTFLATMVSENVLMLGYGGEYVLGPSAVSILDKEGK